MTSAIQNILTQCYGLIVMGLSIVVVADWAPLHYFSTCSKRANFPKMDKKNFGTLVLLLVQICSVAFFLLLV